MALNAKVRNHTETSTDNFDWNFTATNPIDIEVKTPFVTRIEKPKESFDDLCVLAQKHVSSPIEYNIKNMVYVKFK